MFANLLQLISRHPPAEDYDVAFVREVAVHAPAARNPRTLRVLLAGWLLIAGKCWLVTWLIEKYRVPIDPLWVVGPTVLFALLCTAVYYRRD